MHCGRISVKGEAEETAVSPRSRSRQKHGKKSNPYSSGGLDKFGSVYAELSAKRQYIAKKTGAPEALVRFLYSENGWRPVVVRPREENGKKNVGGVASGDSILGSEEKIDGEKDGKLRRKYKGNDGDSILGSEEKIDGEKDGKLRRKDKGNDINGVSESFRISGFHERSHSLFTQLFPFLKITVFWFLGLSAMWVRRAAIVADAALTLVMAVGGGMSMEKFILSGVSYFTTLFRNTMAGHNGGGMEEIAEQNEVCKLSRRTSRLGLTVSAPRSPLRAHLHPIEFSTSASPKAVKQGTIDPEHKHHHTKAKTFRRVVSMENRPTRSATPLGSDSFYRRARSAMAIDSSVAATVIIITLLCLVFSGRLCAIFFTSLWWYLLPVLVPQQMRGINRNNNCRMLDHQSNENMMKVIMDGLLGREHD